MIDHDPTRNGVASPLPSNRKFGLTFSGLFFFLGLAGWFVFGKFVLWPLLSGAILLIISIVLPQILGLPNKIWMKFGDLLHRLVSPIILGIMFFLLITPLGLLMKALGKRPIPLQFDRDIESYWIARTPPGPTPDSMRNQF